MCFISEFVVKHRFIEYFWLIEFAIKYRSKPRALAMQSVIDGDLVAPAFKDE